MNVKSKWIISIFPLVILSIFCTTSAHAATWYVDGSVGASGDGTSWHTAFKTINEAIPWAVLSDEIWVKRGVYPISSTINLNMKMIKIYGGFAGGETELSQRDIKNNTTTIDGQNLHRVFYVYYGAPRIDGFTIMRGKTGSYLTANSNGGAIYFDQCMDLVPVVINCVFKDNLAEKLGGAIFNYSSSPYIINCSFYGNVAWWKGGAIFTTGTSMPFITNCTFTNNHAGGSIGGWDVGHGGAIFSDPGSYPTITNSILWGNSSFYPEDMEIAGSNANNVTYSNVNQDGFEGTNGNIRQDPLLSGSGKLRLLPGSPCIDAGNNNAFPYLPLTDYFGNDRIIDGNGDSTATVDMGAHEYVPGEVVVAWFVNGAVSASGDGSSWSQAFKTIQEAVDAAANGNDIYVRAGTYGAVSVSKALNFYGGYDGTTVVDCQNVAWSNGFYINNTNVSIYGFTIKRASESGIRSVNSSLTVTNSIFTANQGTGVSGGGISVISGGGATINNCTFTGNSASFNGGAVHATGSITGPITISNSTFTNNHANREGGAFSSTAASAPLIFNNCTFTNNSSDFMGGAIYSVSSLTLSNSAFSTNSATQGGGAIYNTGSSNITGCTFSNNLAGSYSSGGAILNLQSGTHSVSNSRFLGNTAGEDGGGIASGNLTVLTSIFAGNRAINPEQYRGMGGAIYGGGTAQIINSTFYGNSASYAGGGVFLGETGGTCSQFRVFNSILWGNTAPNYKETGAPPDPNPIWGCYDVFQYSDIEQSGFSGHHGNINQNPLFVNVSGTDPMNWDLHLQTGSPCVDKGSNTVPGLPAFDVDGEPRTMDGDGDTGAVVDMGVDEVTGPADTNPPTGTILINGGSTATTSQNVSLNLNVSDPSGMSQMCISDTISCTSWETFSNSKNWTLTAGDGNKTIYGWFKDFFGNTTPAAITASIFLDTAPPVDGTLTATPIPYFGTIQLTWSGFSDASSGVAYYTVVYRNDGIPSDCNDGYQVYNGANTSYVFVYGSPGVTFSFRVCAFDHAGHISTGATASAMPDFDTTEPTGSIVINGGNPYTRTSNVTLTISASDPVGVTHMCITDNPSPCKYWWEWEPFASSKEIYFYNQGEQTAYIWFRDSFYNTNSTPFSDSIIVDWEPPTDGSLSATPGNGTISLNWSGFSDGASGIAEYKLVYEPGGNPYCSSSPVLYQGSDTSFVHSGLTNGIWYYYRVCATDIAGNESWGVEAWALPPASAPTGLHITGYVNRGINVSWITDLNQSIDWYVIQFRPSWASWWNEYYATGDVSTYTLTNLNWGETYVIRVLALYAYSQRTDPSNEVSGAVKQPTIDFDGDGTTDIAVWRPGNGVWYIVHSSDQTVDWYQWGSGSLNDVPVPGDYDGDGKTDCAVWRPSEGMWYILGSRDGFMAQQWGMSEDVPVPVDYDGDGKTDIAVWRPSEGVWYILGSQVGLIAQQWGTSGDVLVPGDYDGDGKTDIAVWRPSEGIWYILGSQAGFMSQQWGASGDVPVPGDYDADGKTDIAVWRPSEGIWYILGSQAGFMAQQWGTSGDVVVPGDYDGDGKTDIGVWRSSEGTWYILGSQTGFMAQQWGAGSLNDQPISQ